MCDLRSQRSTAPRPSPPNGLLPGRNTGSTPVCLSSGGDIRSPALPLMQRTGPDQGPQGRPYPQSPRPGLASVFTRAGLQSVSGASSVTPQFRSKAAGDAPPISVSSRQDPLVLGASPRCRPPNHATPAPDQAQLGRVTNGRRPPSLTGKSFFRSGAPVPFIKAVYSIPGVLPSCPSVTLHGSGRFTPQGFTGSLQPGTQGLPGISPHLHPDSG
ncbi:hypothetical protein NDU88_004529 [Pleurodeles waltl]|uniref:Uncharacterized protein n=1 Tax=Pleurodeles waltl TaxID=8319 RepID=A0AAV7LK65_PLEWA|nr:hypothetical protein NDU88_004529 [Pleurodeles waltl]